MEIESVYVIIKEHFDTWNGFSSTPIAVIFDEETAYKYVSKSNKDVEDTSTNYSLKKVDVLGYSQ